MYAPVSPDEHTRRMTLYAQGLNDYTMADALGINWNAIRHWRHENKLPANSKRPAPKKLTLEQEKRRREMYERGMTDREIAKVQGVTRKAIYNWRAHRRLGVNSGGWAGVPMYDVLPVAGCQLVNGFLRCAVAYAKQLPPGRKADMGMFIAEWRKQKFGVVRGKWVGMRTMREAGR